MGDQKSDDWLPEGWKVEVRVRRNGKKDKCYFGPSNGVKFYSKLEVCRYLKIDYNESEENDKGPSKQCGKNVVFEKGTADGLPPGWTKEIKVTKKGRKVRRDPYYTDPVTGYVFRSMKDVLRYLDTGDLGRLASKPKDKGSDDVKLENDKNCSPNAAKKQKLDVNGTRAKSMSQSSELHEITNDEQTLHDAGSTGECKSLSEFTSENCGLSAELRNSKLPEAGGSEHVEGSKTLEESATVTDSGGVVDAKLRGSNLREAGVSEHVEGGKKLEESAMVTDYEGGMDAKLGGLNLPEAGFSEHVEGREKLEESAKVDYEGGLGAKLRGSNLPEAEGSEHVEGGKKLEETATVTNSEGGVGAKLRGSNLPEAVGSGHVEGGKYLNKAFPVSTSAVEEFPDKQSPENGMIITEKKTHNSKRKKAFNTPRRASKRLAGVPLDPTPELETIYRTRRTAGKQSGETDLKCTIDDKKSAEELAESSKSKHPSRNLSTSPGHVEKMETENKSDAKQGNTVVLPMDNIASPGEHAGNVEADDKVNEKPKHTLDLPLVDLWTDPCIAFAIKTLTGASFDTSENAELSPVTKNRGNPSGIMSIAEEHSRKEEPRNGSDKKQGCSAALPMGNLATSKEHAKGIESCDEKPGCTVDMPFMDIWRDPCIEFAIKTLTGAIPVALDMNNQDYYQQQVSSSQMQASSCSTLPDVGLDNFCQTEFLCQQFDAAEKHVPKEQTALPSSGPGFNPSRNVGLQNSGATNLQQRSQWRYRG